MFGNRKTQDILERAPIEDGVIGRSLHYAHATKEKRKEVIRADPRSLDGKVAAAIEIQRAYRGYCTRCRLLNTLQPNLSKTVVYSDSKHPVTRLEDVRSPSPVKAELVKKSRARLKLEGFYQDYVNRMLGEGHHPDAKEIVLFEDFCANFIQNWWQKVITKLRAKRQKKKPPPPKPVRPKRTSPLTENEAASIIQRVWRRHIDIQVFRYYRDLINFKQRGDPGMMLRCINPNEAKYLDSASGVHIKFRLAGDRFPPNIYYKVFTHRPIQDLCANSPKDYTAASSKRQMAKDVHNKGNRVNSDQSTEGWYRRIENNGWRLVSDRLVHHLMSDPVTYNTSKKEVQFHHNKLQRKVDVEKKRKKRKIEWMQKMYKQGMLKAQVEDEDTIELIEGAAAGMVATVDKHGPFSVHEWEVDELLDWTTGLNFDDYWAGWKQAATSANSEKPVEDRLQFLATYNKADPFELTVSMAAMAKKRDGSTRQSHNTPVSSQSVGSINY